MSAKDVRDAIERFQDAVADEARMSAAGTAAEEWYGMDYWKGVDARNVAKMDLIRAIEQRQVEVETEVERQLRQRFDFRCKHRWAKSPEGEVCSWCGVPREALDDDQTVSWSNADIRVNHVHDFRLVYDPYDDSLRGEQCSCGLWKTEGGS